MWVAYFVAESVFRAMTASYLDHKGRRGNIEFAMQIANPCILITFKSLPPFYPACLFLNRTITSRVSISGIEEIHVTFIEGSF
jgi:hypothetical protein